MQQTDEMKQAVFRQEYEKTYGPMRAAKRHILGTARNAGGPVPEKLLGKAPRHPLP